MNPLYHEMGRVAFGTALTASALLLTPYMAAAQTASTTGNNTFSPEPARRIIPNFTPNFFHSTNVLSGASSTSSTTPVAIGTTTEATSTSATSSPSSSGDVQSLIQQILGLIARLQDIIGPLPNLSASSSSASTALTAPASMPSTLPTSPASDHISNNSVVVHEGTSVDFTGSGFGHEESVLVTSGGTLVSTAHADGGGNFSTGTLAVPMMVGTKTYTFTGKHSGIVGTAAISIIP